MIAISRREAQAVSGFDDANAVVEVLRRGQFTTFLGQACCDAQMQANGVEGTLRALRRIGQMINEGKVVA